MFGFHPFIRSLQSSRFFSTKGQFGQGLSSKGHILPNKIKVIYQDSRFENAVASVEKAKQLDASNMEVIAMLNNVRSVAHARAQITGFSKSGNYVEASTAYGQGLKYDPSNPVLLCNRAVCREKLEQWERSIEDCNEALRIQPKHVKSLLRRAASYVKLQKWAEAVKDYEALRKTLPDDKEVAESLFHAQIALKVSREEEVSNIKFGGEVEEIFGVDQFRTEISLTGVSVVYFMTPSEEHCIQIGPFSMRFALDTRLSIF